MRTSLTDFTLARLYQNQPVAMNIWIFNHYAVTPEQPGGTRHFDFARELVRRGHRVSILASAYLHHAQNEKLLQGRTWVIEEDDGVKMIWLRTCRYTSNNWRRGLGMFLYAVRSLTLLRRIAKGTGGVPSVVLGSTPHPLAALAACIAARSLGSRFIFEVRDLWPETPVRMGLIKERGLVAGTMRLIEKYLAKQAQRLILVPPAANLYYRDLGVEATKLVEIPNGVALEPYKNIKKTEEQSEGFAIVYTGAHGATNGLDILLKAAEIVQQEKEARISFHLVGEGPEKPRLIQMAERLGLSNVKFTDAVPKRQIPQILLRADAVIHLEKGIPGLEKFGSCPNKVFDYLASGRPLIISSPFLPTLPEESKYAVRVEPENATQLARAVIKLSKRPGMELEEMGAHARRVVQQTHSIEVLTDQLEATLAGRIELMMEDEA